MFSVGAIVVATMTTTTAMVGLKRMHGTAYAARADGVSSIPYGALPTQIAWTTPVDARGKRMMVVAGLPVPERVSLEALDAQDDAEEEKFITGSIAAYLPAVSAPVVVSSLAAIPLEPAIPAAALPLPAARPRLASLPSGNPVIAPEEDPNRSKTAIYDITAKMVYLPSGEKLEAHSGYGPFMDDPGNVHRKMRGATPPNTYKLTEREALFHGVRALRMTPIGDGKMYNRDGILAHSYLLGPSGQSHGCVSFKDYPRFLRAYLRGEINRIVVVTRLEKPPAFYAGLKAANTNRAF